MAKNESERQTVRLAKNSFLNMYVYDNPNKKYLDGKNHSDEFCDCLIHVANYDIIIQVKQNDTPEAKDWFDRNILSKARWQLTGAFAAICSTLFEVWDKKNKHLISKCNQNPERVLPIIVFQKDELYMYQQVGLPDRIKGIEDKKHVPCNIFSMDDFECATSMIPTVPDFLDYLVFRYNKLKDLDPGIQLFPFFIGEKGIMHAFEAHNNEQIMVAEFFSRITDNPEVAFKSARMWHTNILGLENDGTIDQTFIKLLSFVSIKNIIKWDDCFKTLIKKSDGKHCVWLDKPVLIGNVDDRKYGIMLSYLPIDKCANTITNNGDKEMRNDAERALKNDSLSGVYLFQYTKSKIVRLSKIC